MHILKLLLSLLCGMLLCVVELTVAAPTIGVGFAYRGPYGPPPTALPYFEDDGGVAPSLYPDNPYPLGYSYGYRFGSFALAPYVI